MLLVFLSCRGALDALLKLLVPILGVIMHYKVNQKKIEVGKKVIDKNNEEVKDV